MATVNIGSTTKVGGITVSPSIALSLPQIQGVGIPNINPLGGLNLPNPKKGAIPNGVISKKITQPVTINDIEFDALISQDKKLEADVPEYPTEQGFSVSASIIRKSMTLEMTLFISDAGVTWRKKHGGGGRVQSIPKRLEELYLKGEPVTVKTCDETFENMAIQSITISKNVETGRYSREIPISFKQILVTTSETTTIPEEYGKSGESEAYEGDADTEEVNNGSNDGGGDTRERTSLGNIGKNWGVL